MPRRALRHTIADGANNVFFRGGGGWKYGKLRRLLRKSLQQPCNYPYVYWKALSPEAFRQKFFRQVRTSA
jgi:hypothetical protein